MNVTKRILEPTDTNYKLAADCVRNGGILIAPSDTNVALTLNPWIDTAIQKAFRIKNRPPHHR